MNQCVNIPCEWWWCNTNNGCLHKHLSCRQKSYSDTPKVEVDLYVRKKISKIDAFNQRELKKDKHSKKVIRCTNIYCATTENITQHHLFPKGYRNGIIGRIGRVPLCRPCHDRVHFLKENGELARHYNTKQRIIDLLASDVKHRVKRFMYTYVNTQVAQRAVA